MATAQGTKPHHTRRPAHAPEGRRKRLSECAERMHQLARYLGKGLRAVARESGVDLELLRSWMLGVDEPDAGELARLANVVGEAHASPISFMLGLDDTPVGQATKGGAA